MDIKFCDMCDNFMNFCIDKDKKPIFTCTRCDNTSEYDFENDSKGIQFNKNIELKNILNNNRFLTMDPTLPIIENDNMKCVNSECESIKDKKPTKITYIKYDEENIYFMYICKYCSQRWTNNI
jgi:hypothetical protein